MMVIIIPVFLLSIFLVQTVIWKVGIRKAFIQAVLGTFLMIAVSTEILSLFNLLQHSWVSGFWLVLSGLAIFYLIREATISDLAKFFQKIGSDLQTFSRREYFVLGGILIFLIITLMIAIISPPNNFDSMTYHMARVVHWIQHQNVRFYPTWIERQNHAMPLAEFAILHLQILSRSDQFANLIQWSTYLGVIILSTLIGQEFRLSFDYQTLTAVLVTVIPMAVLQSTSTQNDLVVSFFLLSFGYYLIRYGKTDGKKALFLAAVSLGLSLLTKGTAYVYGAALGLTFGVSQLIQGYRVDITKSRRIFFRLVLIVILALVLSLGHFTRNFNLYGNPLSTANNRVTTDQISLPIVFANLTRNAVVHFATPFGKFNQVLTEMVRGLLGQHADYYASTFPGSRFKIIFFLNEDYAGNFIHFLLLSVSLILLGCSLQKLSSSIRWYTASIFLSILLFNIFFKWQPWGTRLQLPIFILGMPLVSLMISRINFSKLVLNTTLFILFIGGMPFLLFNEVRPVFPVVEKNPLETIPLMRDLKDKQERIYRGVSRVIKPIYGNRSLFVLNREELYFMTYHDLYKPYKLVVEEINMYKPEEVGLFLDNNNWEYPFWVLLGSLDIDNGPDLQHVGVENETRKLKKSEQELPRFVIATKNLENNLIGGVYFELVFKTDEVSIYQQVP